ncbi:MAG TPA: aminotransferase class V-fold PLP-dependent enzyme [Puia sp.]|nr:aminotransferase class V-fold PLP-dependent enzyme [Puia sp.]
MKRRELIKNLSILPIAGSVAGSGLARLSPGQENMVTNHPPSKSMYETLGVRPIINGRGTITIIGGSRILPEVEAAMREATQDYVMLDELMDGVGKRLGELTGAEWGVVTTGATGALIIGTLGVITGGNPDKLWQIPDMKGLKNEVIIPDYSWTAYESAVRGIGVKMVTVKNKEELISALGPQTAMVLVLAGQRSMAGPLSLKEISDIVKPMKVPVMVDAAAEGLPVPNPHIQAGADLVCYSGGKILNGPQCAGLLIGRKDLMQAAWVTSAPHHGFARGYKVGREEVLGMLAAVEMWMKRDHAKENQAWTVQLKYIDDKIKGIPGVTTSLHQPTAGQLSNPSPGLRVSWDMKQIPLTGDDIEQLLWNGNPRVAVGGAGSFLPFPPNMNPTIHINTSQLRPGEEKIIAEQVYKVLSNPPKLDKPSGAAAFDVGGQWDMELKFVAETATQTLVLDQQGNHLNGTHFGSYATRDLEGEIYGNKIMFRSAYTLNGVRLDFEFRGEVSSNDAMGGTLSLSEYRTASWTAKRHQYKVHGAR